MKQAKARRDAYWRLHDRLNQYMDGVRAIITHQGGVS